MSAKALTMSAVAVAVAAGTYFGLETLYPQQHEKAVVAETVSPDDIFGKPLAPPSPDAAVDETVSSGETIPAEAAIDARTAEIAASEPEHADDASEPPVEDMAATEVADSDDAMQMPVESEPEPPPTPEPTPAATPEPTFAPTPAPPATKAPAPAKPASKPIARAPKLTQWWEPVDDTRLSLLYAGSAAYKRAIVLMFNGAFDGISSAAQNITITDAGGSRVVGRWEVGANNKRMLVFPVENSGIYTVSIDGHLSDRDNRPLERSLRGPVNVR
jgi:hypothetical protein